jgi:hypothetical protein
MILSPAPANHERWQSPGRVFSVMKGSAENHQIHAVGIDRRILQISQAKFEIFQAVLFACLAPNATIFSELSTAITCWQRRASNSLNNPSPEPKSATTNGAGFEKQLARFAPGASWTVMAIKTASHLIEIGLGLFLAASQNPLQIHLVVGISDVSFAPRTAS